MHEPFWNGVYYGCFFFSGASGVGYVPRGKSKEGDDQVLCIYLGGYEERKRHVDDGAGNNRGGCSIPRDSVFVGELFEQWEMIVCLEVWP